MGAFAEKLEEILNWGGSRKTKVVLAVSGAALLVGALEPAALPFNAAWVAAVLCGVPIVVEALIGLFRDFDIKADLLVALALAASIAIGQVFAAGEVAFIMQLGELLEDLTLSRAWAGIESLVRLTPRTARVVLEGKEKVVPAQEVAVGDVLRVLPGETVPVDGQILSGTTSINQAVMTGEPLPVDKGPGDPVSSGTVNQFGAFDMVARKVGEDSLVQRMVAMVRSADAGKARIVRLADKWATWIVVASLAAAAATWAATGEAVRAVTVLVVFCPCSLVLATPTAIMAAIGNAARHGFLVREGQTMERLAMVSKVVFDKTGTLTSGVPQVVAVETLSQIPASEVYALAAAAERLSEHPLGKAIVRCHKKDGGPALESEGFQMLPGLGVRAVVEGRTVEAGSRKLAGPAGDAERTGAEAWMEKGATVVYVAVDGKPAGFLALADTLRPESPAMVASLRALEVEPVLLTGDSRPAAEAIAGKLGIAEVHAESLPEDKLRYLEERQRGGQALCMVGDGVNDAPALRKADVGIAMGGVGSDIAIEAASVALVDDQIRELPHFLALSRRTMRTIRLNLAFAMALNLAATALAAAGLLGPVGGALAHNAGSVLVIANSALLLGWRERRRAS